MSGEKRNNDIFSGAPGDRAKMTGMPVRNTMKDDFGLDIPTELVPLPSGGKVYPEGSPLFGKDTLENSLLNDIKDAAIKHYEIFYLFIAHSFFSF